jgi:hypothetical protein
MSEWVQISALRLPFSTAKEKGSFFFSEERLVDQGK